MIDYGRKVKGYTLLELLLAIVLASILMLGLSGIANLATQTYKTVHDQNNLSRQARFAMQRMVRAVSYSRLLLLPFNDVSSTNWLENIREETVPPTTPSDDSTKYTAVLAVTLPLYSNLNGDDFPDADDDKDGKVDEDLPNDRNYDSAPGIYLIDDDGDGSVDEGTSDNDDDERNSSANEDPINGIDDDSDNNVDEDPGSDMNADSCPGICGVDDDGDGQVDEGSADDDDENGDNNEDWYNPVVFYLDNGTLKERTPVPWDENGSGGITGQDFITSDIAENVSRFRVERILVGNNRAQLVDLILELTSSVTGETVSLHTQVRVGGGL
jgi:prepilin-type N-terminal cleavage/methylation domain-containing protein